MVLGHRIFQKIKKGIMRYLIAVLVGSWFFLPLKSIAHEVIRKVGEAPHPVVHFQNHQDKMSFTIVVGIGIFLILLTLALKYGGPGEIGPGGGGFSG